MLAEIFLVRLQTLLRSRAWAMTVKSVSDPRFVPIVLPRS